MSWLDSILPAWWPRSSNTTLPAPPHGISFFPVGNHHEIAHINLVTNTDLHNAFYKCPPLAAIISKKASAFANGKFEVLNRETQNYTRGKYKEWDYLLNKPNPMQNRIQFLKQLYAYNQIYGYCYAIPIYPVGFKDRPSSIWLLPNWCLHVELKDKTRIPFTYTGQDSVRKIVFTWGGTDTELREEDLILFTDTTTTIDHCTWLPKSRLCALQDPIDMVRSTEEAGLTVIQKRGPLGLISDDSKDPLGNVAMSAEDKAAVQQGLQGYGLTRQQSQYIMTSQNLKWVPIGSSIADLQLSPMKLEAIRELCDGLDFPFPLMAFSDQSTYNNIKTADRILYQNAIIPDSLNLVEQLNQGLKTPDQNIEFIISYEHVPALQDSEKEKGDGRKAMGDAALNEYKNNLITKNRVLEIMGEDTVPGWDIYYFQSEEYQQQQNLQRERFNINNNEKAKQTES